MPDEEHGDSAHDARHAAGRDRRISSARKPADDAGADRPARGRRGARRPDLPRHLRRRRARAGILARQRSPSASISPTPRTRSPLWVKLTPTIVMLIGLWIAWNNYIRDPAAPARFVAHLPGGLPVRAQQMVFRRALRRPVRPPGAVARPAVLEGRGRGDDRPLRPARRGLCGRHRQPHRPRGCSPAISTATRW